MSSTATTLIAAPAPIPSRARLITAGILAVAVAGLVALIIALSGSTTTHRAKPVSSAPTASVSVRSGTVRDPVTHAALPLAQADQTPTPGPNVAGDSRVGLAFREHSYGAVP